MHCSVSLEVWRSAMCKHRFPLIRLQLKVFPTESAYHESLKQLLGQGLCTCINR
jgi:hypothetical protein